MVNGGGDALLGAHDLLQNGLGGRVFGLLLALAGSRGHEVTDGHAIPKRRRKNVFDI